MPKLRSTNGSNIKLTDEPRDEINRDPKLQPSKYPSPPTTKKQANSLSAASRGFQQEQKAFSNAKQEEKRPSFPLKSQSGSNASLNKSSEPLFNLKKNYSNEGGFNSTISTSNSQLNSIKSNGQSSSGNGNYNNNSSSSNYNNSSNTNAPLFKNSNPSNSSGSHPLTETEGRFTFRLDLPPVRDIVKKAPPAPPIRKAPPPPPVRK